MFEDSTRVVIISSSHTKNVGPRIGSIGYATPMPTEPTFLSHPSQFTNGFVLFALRIVFTRYGYEKKRPKYEVKKLIGAIPIVNELRKNLETERTVRKLLENLPKNDLDSHAWLKAKVNLLGKTDNINICILVPTKNNPDLRTCSNSEFDAWIKSVMLQEHFKTSIKKILNNRACFRRLPNRRLIGIVDTVEFGLKSKEKYNTFVKYILEKENRRKDLIELVRTVRAIHSRSVLVHHSRVISRALGNGGELYRKGTDSANAITCRLINFMFIDHMTKWKMELLSKAKMVKNRNSMATKIIKTKEVLESIADEVYNK